MLSWLMNTKKHFWFIKQNLKLLFLLQIDLYYKLCARYCDRVRSTLYSVSSNILCSDKHQRPLLLPLFSIVLRDIYSLYACLTWHLSLDLNHKHDNTPQTAWYLLPTVSHWSMKIIVWLIYVLICVTKFI